MKLDIPSFLKSPRRSPHKDQRKEDESKELKAKLPRTAFINHLGEWSGADDSHGGGSASSILDMCPYPIDDCEEIIADSIQMETPSTPIQAKRRASLHSSTPWTRGVVTPAFPSFPARIQLRRRASLSHIPSQTHQSKPKRSKLLASSAARKSTSSSQSTRTYSSLQKKGRRHHRSSMGHYSVRGMVTPPSSPRRNSLLYSKQPQHHQTVVVSPPFSPGQLRRRESLRQLFALDNAPLCGTGRDAVFSSHRDVIQLQSFWQVLSKDDRNVLAETILWHVLEHDSAARQQLGIRSFRSEHTGKLITLLVETLDCVISHAGPDISLENFEVWKTQWTSQGLSGLAVAKVLLDGVGEFGRYNESVKTTGATLHAWECIVIPVLRQWQ